MRSTVTPASAPASTQDTADCGYVATGPTNLRCAKCAKSLMVKDAKRTPTGYVCPNYVKGRIATFYNAKPQHYFIGAVLALVMGAVVGYISSFLWLFLAFIVGPLMGTIMAEVIQRALKGVRGEHMWLVAAVAAATGGLAVTIGPSLVLGFGVRLLSLLNLLALVLAIGTMVANLRGIVLWRR